jgi:hypothetical protein
MHQQQQQQQQQQQSLSAQGAKVHTVLQLHALGVAMRLTKGWLYDSQRLPANSAEAAAAQQRMHWDATWPLVAWVTLLLTVATYAPANKQRCNIHWQHWSLQYV